MPDTLEIEPTRMVSQAVKDAGFSDRIIEIGNAISNGLTNEEIAELFGIESSTVKVYVRKLSRALNAARRHHLALYFPPTRVYKAPVPPEEDAATRRYLDLVIEGLPDAEIGLKMGNLLGRVNAFTRKMRKETGFHTRNEMAIWWMIEKGMIPQGDGSFPAEHSSKFFNRPF